MLSSRGNGRRLAYRAKLGITGRLWPDKGIISFWNASDDVIEHWDRVEKMFDDFKHRDIHIGKLENYKIDWLERARRRDSGKYSPMTSASSISSKRDTPRQPDFLKVLFNSPQRLPELGSDEIEALQKKLHMMNPAQKKVALNMMGKKNVKAIEIANKLGITVAEFNHLMHQGLDEIEDEKMPNMSVLAKQLTKQ